MGAFLGSAVFSAAVFFYCLGLIFAVVGYIGDWLEPRNVNSDILSVGIREVCFEKYTFETDSRVEKEVYDGCYDSTKTSEWFADIPSEYVRPSWYTMIQDMYLASLILIFLTLIIVIGFLISYCTLKQQIKKRQRPSSTLILSKAVLALWFILAAVAGVMLIVGPTIFHQNYKDSGTVADDTVEFKYGLFETDSLQFKYGPGFAITIVGGASLLISTLLEFIVFLTIVRKMHRFSSGDAKMVFTDEFANIDADGTEMERLSNEELDNIDDENSTQVTVKKAYPVAAPRKQLPSEHPQDQSYQNIPKSKEAAADTERVDEGGQSYQNIPRPRPKSAAAPQPAKRLSLHGPPKGNSGTDSSHGYKPDYYSESKERSVAPGSRSIAGESMASTAYPPSTAYAPSNASPSLAGRSYSRLQHSDTESVRSGNRNVTVARSAAGGDNSSMASSNVPPPTVIQPGRTSANKHSRYAAMY